MVSVIKAIVHRLFRKSASTIRSIDEPMGNGERQLWESISHDERAWRKIVTKYYRPMLYSTVCVVRSREVALHIVEEAFNVLKRKPRLMPADGFERRKLLWSRQRMLVFKELIEIRKEWNQNPDKFGIDLFQWMQTRKWEPGMKTSIEESKITQKMIDEFISIDDEAMDDIQPILKDLLGEIGVFIEKPID